MIVNECILRVFGGGVSKQSGKNMDLVVGCDGEALKQFKCKSQLIESLGYYCSPIVIQEEQATIP